MITLDVKFPQSSAKITSATNSYNISREYFGFEYEYETITDDILNEINRKGKYTSKAKSGQNGSLLSQQEVNGGTISQTIRIELVLNRKTMYNNYYVFSSGGFVNPQDSYKNFIKKGKIKSKFQIGMTLDAALPPVEVSIATNEKELEYYINSGHPVIAKDFDKKIIERNVESFEFLVDIYVSPKFVGVAFPMVYLYFDYEASTYYLESYSAQEITITGENLDFLGLSFGGSGYSYPLAIQTKENIYELNEDTILIKDLNGANSFHFVFMYWNTPNSEIVINDIFTTEINVNRTNLISAESNLSYRADKKMPSFGILSNTGNLEFNDIDGRIKLFAENNMLKSDVKVELYLRNTLTNTQEQIGNFYTDVWNYDNDNRQVSVSLKDGLEELQDITPTEKLEYDPRNPKPLLLRDIYTFLWQRTPRKYGFITYGSLDETTKDIMLNTVINYPLIEQGTLWQMWTKLCEVGGLYIYKQADGLTRCSYAYGG